MLHVPDGLENGIGQARLNQIIETRKRDLALAAQGLNTLSPLATLERGYAIVSTLEPDASILKDATSVSIGDKIKARLFAGEIVASVESIQPAFDDEDKDDED